MSYCKKCKKSHNDDGERALCALDGMLADLNPDGKLDAVELVREVRDEI